ncbi:hypothetical protein MHBO_001685 [Bonamia ostreae]|uniref:Rab-GAP TBC domain-containing protein n=1 Tax=Bonamia ostreae TaxID=126728 RepID=A0ABV2AKM2_9EUKA
MTKQKALKEISTKSKLKAQKLANERHLKWLEMIFGKKSIRSKANTNVETIECDEFALIRQESDPKKFCHKKMRSRIRKGIPSQFRRVIWQHLSGSFITKLDNPDLYGKIIASKKMSPVIFQIEKDINRTYQSGSFSREYEDRFSKSIFNVLNAFSLYCSEIGYCQGMNNICALLLNIMTEEDAFWMLVSLADNPLYSMRGCWKENMPSTKLRFYQLVRILAFTIF